VGSRTTSVDQLQDSPLYGICDIFVEETVEEGAELDQGLLPCPPAADEKVVAVEEGRVANGHDFL
jgi:hypothetical protein